MSHQPLLPAQLAVQHRLDTEALQHAKAQLRGDRYIEPRHHHRYVDTHNPEAYRHDDDRR